MTCAANFTFLAGWAILALFELFNDLAAPDCRKVNVVFLVLGITSDKRSAGIGGLEELA